MPIRSGMYVTSWHTVTIVSCWQSMLDYMPTAAGRSWLGLTTYVICNSW